MRATWWFGAALFALAAAGCQCNRNTLSNRFGDVELVVPLGDGSESLTREGTLTLEPVAMLTQGTGQARLRNVGDGTVKLVRLTQVSGSTAFTLELPSNTDLQSQDEATLAISFSPPQDDDATLATVEHRAVFHIETQGTRDGEGTVSLELVAQAVGRDCLVPKEVDFGSVPLTTQASASMHLQNNSGLRQTPTFGVVSGDDAASFALAGQPPEAVASGETADVTFTFTPLAERPYSATMTVRRSANCPEASTRLVAVGSNDALTWSPTAVDFGHLPLNEMVTRQVTFTNRASVSVHASFTVEGAGFGMQGPNQVDFASKQDRAVTVTCKMTSIGPKTGNLVVELATAPVRTLRVPLSCAGGGPRIRLKPDLVLPFGAVPYATQTTPLPTSRRVTISNVGTPPPAPDSTENNLFLGPGGGPPFVSIQANTPETTATAFTVSLPPDWDNAKGLPAVAGKNTLDLDVHFTPWSTTPQDATLTVYSNDPLTPAATLRLTATPLAAGLCTLSVDPTSVSFGDLPRGSRLNRTVLLVNSSDTACLVSGLEIAPGSDPAFGTTSAPNLNIGPHQTGVVEVQVTVPSSAQDGDMLTGFLRFSVNSKATPMGLVPLGVRVSPCLVTTPSALDFGTVKIGCHSASRSVTLYNACASNIVLDAVRVVPQPSRFTVVVGPSAGTTLFPGAPVTLSLNYGPNDLMRNDGDLQIDANEAGEKKTVHVALTGVGASTSVNVDSFVEPERAPADLLFVVDNSCSMFDEQAELASNFGSFISYATKMGVPYQIAVTTTDDSPTGAQGQLLRGPGNPMVLTPSTPNVAKLFAAKVNVGTSGSGQEQPLSAALKALTVPLTATANRGFLRPDASLSVVVVSDAPDQSSNTAAYYLNRFLGLVPPQKTWLFSFSVIGPFSNPLPPGCSIDSTIDMGRYAPIVAATKGVQADICTKDWAKDLEAIGRNALGPRDTLYLTTTVDPGQPVTVTVNGAPITNWSLDPASNAVILADTVNTPSGAKVEVTYSTPCY